MLVAALCAPPTAFAHPVPFSYLDLRLSGNGLEGALVAHIFDLGRDLNIEPAEKPEQVLWVDPTHPHGGV